MATQGYCMHDIEQEETKVSFRPGVNQKCQVFLLKWKTKTMRSSTGPEVIQRKCRVQKKSKENKSK